LSRDHSKNLFDFSSNNELVFIQDPHNPQTNNYENSFFESALETNSAMKAIANHISNISQSFESDTELVLAGNGKGALFLPGIASGLRAHDFTIAGYLLVNANIPGGLDPQNKDFEFYETLPLLSDWPDAPVVYLWSDSNYEDFAKEAKLRGWEVINNTDYQVIKEAANSLFF
jgi:hypothetical protein